MHATHATPAEIDGVAASGAGVVLCPTTEANLGDGLPDLPRWLDTGAGWSMEERLAAARCQRIDWLAYHAGVGGCVMVRVR